MAPLEIVEPSPPVAMPVKLEHNRRALDNAHKADLSSFVPDQTMPPPALTGGKLHTALRDATSAGRSASPAKGNTQEARGKRKSRGARKSSDTKDVKKPLSLTSNANKRARTSSSKPVISNTQRGEAKSPTDPELVKEVRAFMKTYKVSQVVAGQEARVSQAVISQWLSMKYHGHNDKVWRVPNLCSIHPVLS